MTVYLLQSYERDYYNHDDYCYIPTIFSTEEKAKAYCDAYNTKHKLQSGPRFGYDEGYMIYVDVIVDEEI